MKGNIILIGCKVAKAATTYTNTPAHTQTEPCTQTQKAHSKRKNRKDSKGIRNEHKYIFMSAHAHIIHNIPHTTHTNHTHTPPTHTIQSHAKRLLILLILVVGVAWVGSFV